MRLRMLLLAVLMIALPESAFTQTSSINVARVRSMKLLAPKIGWATTDSWPGNRLWWTTTGGIQWKDITPGASGSGNIVSVFFINTDNGWVLLRDGDKFGEPQFDLAATTNAGASWSTTHVAVPGLNPNSLTLAGGGYIAFVDTNHGWANLDVVSSSNFDLGILLMTSDGGRTWRRSPHDPMVAGPITLVTTEEGWLAGGVGDELYVTFDNARTWQEVNLKAPQQLYPLKEATYQIPIFNDTKHGFLPVTYSARGARGAAVLFKTEDGGQNWKVAGIVSNLSEISHGQLITSTIVDSTWITAAVADHSSEPVHVRLSAIGAQGHINATTETASGYCQGARLSFATTAQGWLLTGYHRLLSTSDGGATWTQIVPTPGTDPSTPHRSSLEHHGALLGGHITVLSTTVGGATLPFLAPNLPEKPNAIGDLSSKEARPTPSVRSMALSPSLDGYGSDTNVGMNIGFDKKYVGSNTEMLTWWNNSPYFTVAFYPNGAASHPLDSGLDADWVTGVAEQGWGLIPIWSGPQAPNSCTVKQYRHTFDPDTAEADGEDQADDAADAVGDGTGGLGLPETIIYYDMEQYDNSVCGDAVNSFLEGWISELHADGYAAGVYSSASSVANSGYTNWTTLSPQPDAVWMASYLPQPAVTVWNISGSGYTLDDSFWNNNQRIRQYSENADETWGGVNFPKIDPDVVDALVIGGGGVKSYTFTDQWFEYPGALQTQPAGINKGGPGGALGVITGYYLDEYVNGHGFIGTVGAGTFYGESFDCSEGEDTYPSAINNAGTVVGYYVDSSDAEHGFSWDGTSCTTLDYPDANGTVATGINDAGWMVGFYYDGSWVSHGFINKSGTFTSFDYPGGYYLAWPTIDGLGRITGWYSSNSGGGYPQNGFLDEAGSSDPNSGSFSSISYPGATAWNQLNGINNNGQIVGGGGENGSPWEVWNFMLNGTGYVELDDAVPDGISTAGLNDEVQILGSGGEVATPQY